MICLELVKAVTENCIAYERTELLLQCKCCAWIHFIIIICHRLKRILVRSNKTPLIEDKNGYLYN